MSFRADVAAHVEGCRRSARQPWVSPEKCEIRKSPKHGLGVFAKEDIRAGTLITLYPADGLKSWESEESYNAVEGFPHGIRHEEFPGMSSDVLMKYSAIVPALGEKFVEIVGDPSNFEDSWYLGHMCNDSCMIHDKTETEWYESQRSQNACIGLVPMIAQVYEKWFTSLGIWAQTDIKAGEEIFVTYGSRYWLAMLQQAQSESVDLYEMD